MFNKSSRRFCVAPMIDCTDRHFRFLARCLSHEALLFTEMITTGALLHGSKDDLLSYDQSQHPLVLQLGGSQPNELAQCAQIAMDKGYDEINLNVGCPSDKVQHHKIGACLMAEPNLVKECLQAMQIDTRLPVSIKHRLGLDDDQDYDRLTYFVDTVSAACGVFYIHARNAYLQGLSPKQNRHIPPLDYTKVYRLKQDFPHLQIIINGGINTLEQCQTHLAHVDGVMLGRACYDNTAILCDVDHTIYQTKEAHPQVKNYDTAIKAYLQYMQEQMQQGTAIHHMARHLMGLFHGLPGARNMRRHLSQHMHKPGAGIEVIQDALSLVNYPTNTNNA